MRPPTELGRRLTVHEPIRPSLSLALCAVPGAAIGAALWLGAVGSLAIGIYAFVLTTVLLVALFGESLFVRQVVHEHGLLLTSVLPFWPAYVVPFASIDPDSIAACRYRRPAGAKDPTDAFRPRYRQAPAVDVVSFVGLAPRSARRLAKGRIPWQSAMPPTESIVPELDPSPLGLERWFVSFRHNDAAAERLQAQVRDHVREPGR